MDVTLATVNVMTQNDYRDAAQQNKHLQMGMLDSKRAEILHQQFHDLGAAIVGVQET